MGKPAVPVTPATRQLSAAKVSYVPCLYRYEEHGGTRVAARELGVPEHQVIKTLVLEDDERRPLIVLMHGDLEVSTRQLARAIGQKGVTTCRPDVAAHHTGYQVGGTSPFGTRKPVPVYMERSIADLPVVYINGGHRGFLLAMAPSEIVRLLHPTLVDVGIPASSGR